MNPEKELMCVDCEIKVKNDSKHRGRFLRRHQRDNVCGNYARKKEAERSAMEINAADVRSIEETEAGIIGFLLSLDVRGYLP